jgi:hypothetical protein
VSRAADIYEKLGAFYLGREYDMRTGEMLDEPLLYDSKDLVTHAVVVGMTGSGKTGLGVALLEEAAIDSIPALVVDPKGDLTNLLLNFPELRPEDFLPWINADDAGRAGMSVAEFAAQQATLWRDGLADWDQDGTRIQRLHDAAEFTIYTPGSDSGVPVSILSSFAPPPSAVMEDSDLLNDRISTTVTSLLALLGIDADPIRSREHILLTNILDQAWRKRLHVDLAALIQMVQAPPMQKVGVIDLESFFPSKDRFTLAMSLNNLLASPAFASWLTGEPLDVDRLLHTTTGKPKVSIFSIAHLSETERMFFMSLLLNQTLGWMRSRPGTTSLRALLYIDEIFGYMPPVSEPPSKKPLLTLLKQARAYGVGVVLATQNPVDLDYKGLSNTGTWFLGRLQTERDKQRVLDGLQGASGAAGSGFDRGEIAELLSGLGKRVFLLHNVHEKAPVTFRTRWALSYLAGPMTRTQIRELMRARKGSMDLSLRSPVAAASPPETAPPSPAPTERPQRPVLPPDVPQAFLPLRRMISPENVEYCPHLLAFTEVHFVDTRKGLSAEEEITFLCSLEAGPMGVDWSEAGELDLIAAELEEEPLSGATFADAPPEAQKLRSYTSWRKALANHLYRSRRYNLFRSGNLNEVSKPGETERDFRIRLVERAHEERDEQIEKLRKKYVSKIDTLRERIRKAELRVEREAQEASGAKMQTAISFGATILSAVLGRKTFSSTTVGRATTAARGVGRASKQADDVRRARDDVAAYEEKLHEIEEELAEEIQEIHHKLDPLQEEFDAIQLKPRRTDINIRHLALAWVPFSNEGLSLIAPRS